MTNIEALRKAVRSEGGQLNLPSDFPLKLTLNIMFHLMDGFSDELAKLQNLIGSRESAEAIRERLKFCDEMQKGAKAS